MKSDITAFVDLNWFNFDCAVDSLYPVASMIVFISSLFNAFSSAALNVGLGNFSGKIPGFVSSKDPNRCSLLLTNLFLENDPPSTY